MTRTGRIVALTLGLSATGAIVGAAAGALALLLAFLLSGVHLSFSDLDALWVPATIGATLGAVLTPIAAWMLLRRVPLGRAFLSLAGGTIAGGVVGWFALGKFDGIEGVIGAAILGFLVAAIVLRATSSRRETVATPAGR